MNGWVARVIAFLKDFTEDDECGSGFRQRDEHDCYECRRIKEALELLRSSTENALKNPQPDAGDFRHKAN